MPFSWNEIIHTTHFYLSASGHLELLKSGKFMATKESITEPRAIIF